jgi:hypothetical protein
MTGDVSKVTSREVTPDNLGAVLALDVFEDQRSLVASNARLIEHVKQRPNAATLLSSFRQGPNSPEGFYAKLGFERTGNEHDGEIEIRMRL